MRLRRLVKNKQKKHKKMKHLFSFIRKPLIPSSHSSTMSPQQEITFQAPLNQTCIIYHRNKRRPEHTMLPIPLMFGHGDTAGRNLSPYAEYEEDLRMFVLSSGIRVWKFYTEVIEEHPDGSTHIWSCPKTLFYAMPTSTINVQRPKGMPGFYARRFPSGAFEIRIHRPMLWEAPVERPYIAQEIIEEYYVKPGDIEYTTTSPVKKEDEADEKKEINMYIYNRINKASEKYADFDQSLCDECGGYYSDHRACEGMTRKEIARDNYLNSKEWLFR